MNKVYNPKEIEPKWQKFWLENKTYQPNLETAKKPYYNLMMFPYSSAEGLHVGNMYAFTGADIHGRFKRMQGFDVFEPIGLDGFGIHSENYAIKIGKHPKDQAKVSERHFYDQLHQIGNGFAWDNKLETYDPVYYRWTQWLFVQMYKNGLAYRKTASVNWCPSCKTVLADEQVEGGVCERCKTPTVRKQTPQWFFRITAYAEKLLNNLTKIDWPNKIKIAQRNWIGKSQGVEITWQIDSFDESIITFTTRPDTIYGATFIVLAPDHPLATRLGASPEAKPYIKEALEKTEQQRRTEEKKKTGVDTGFKAIHPLTNEKIPIWIADFVLMNYGTGAVMAVPAHDERDLEFAKKYHLPIKEIKPDPNIKLDNYAKKVITYHLRDWLISRQRYWGPPIPMVNCDKCGWNPVLENELPILLPDIQDYQPKGDGRSPLENAPEDWLYTKCSKCGRKAKRETDVSDTFLDSSWYFLAYPNLKTKEFNSPSLREPPSAARGNLAASDINNASARSFAKSQDDSNSPFNSSITSKWLPVNAYIGGAEHAVLHLLYSRFVWMALQDWKFIPENIGDEPFPFLFSHGLIIKDGAKMSKSRGNVVNPDEYIGRYGADTLRMYLMFVGPYDQGGDFRDSGMAGMYRFLEKVWKLFSDCHCEESATRQSVAKTDSHATSWLGMTANKNNSLSTHLNKTIKKVTEDISKFKYNTSIASLMIFINKWQESKQNISKEDAEKLLKLFSPFAPHLSEEIWHELGQTSSIHQSSWPKYDSNLIKDQVIDFPIQINGKTRAIIQVNSDDSQKENIVVLKAKENPNVKRYLAQSKNINPLFVPGKILNFVIK